MKIRKKRQLPFFARHHGIVEFIAVLVTVLLLIIAVVFYIIFQPERYV